MSMTAAAGDLAWWTQVQQVDWAPIARAVRA
jgi:hypothetical protein